MRNLLALILGLFIVTSTSSSRADQWSDQMIKTRKIDFGVIATGSESRQLVEIKNVHPSTVVVTSVTTSCKCASGSLEQRTIEPGQSVFVEVKMDTQRFRKRKDSNLLIHFRSRQLPHRIPITAYIRTDVVFSPGKIQFNKIDYGKPGKAVVDISYAGRSDWDIKNIKFNNQHLKATLSPPQRVNGLLKFKLTMSLDEKAKPGPLRDLVTIVTNDGTNPYIPLLVEGMIAPDIVASPSIVRVGSVPSGQTAKVSLFLKGKKPFKVENVDCKGMSGCFKATLQESEKMSHLIPVEFTPPNRPGKFTEELIVQIVGREEPLRLNVTGTILN